MIYSAAIISTPNVKTLAQKFLRYLANEVSISFITRGITQTRKKIQVIYFSIRDPYMKFQDPSMHALVTGGIKKRDKQRNEQTSQQQYAKLTFSMLGA